MGLPHIATLLMSLETALFTLAAQTTSFTGTFTAANSQSVAMRVAGAPGNTVAALNLNQQLSEDDYVTGIGPVTPVLITFDPQDLNF